MIDIAMIIFTLLVVTLFRRIFSFLELPLEYNSSYLSKGTVVKTSLGPGKVYDCGCASGIIDIYTDW